MVPASAVVLAASRYDELLSELHRARLFQYRAEMVLIEVFSGYGTVMQGSMGVSKEQGQLICTDCDPPYKEPQNRTPIYGNSHIVIIRSSSKPAHA